MQLYYELKKYIKMRQLEYEVTGKTHLYRFFCMPIGHSYREKIDAAKKLLRELEGKPVNYNYVDRFALKNGRLGKILSRHADDVPLTFRKFDGDYQMCLATGIDGGFAMMNRQRLRLPPKPTPAALFHNKPV